MTGAHQTPPYVFLKGLSFLKNITWPCGVSVPARGLCCGTHDLVLSKDGTGPPRRESQPLAPTGTSYRVCFKGDTFLRVQGVFCLPFPSQSFPPCVSLRWPLSTVDRARRGAPRVRLSLGGGARCHHRPGGALVADGRGATCRVHTTALLM